MDDIEKALRKMSPKEREAAELLMIQLIDDYRKVPGIKPLKGMKTWFRVRMGNYRIMFVVDAKTKKADIRRLTRKNEYSYKNLD